MRHQFGADQQRHRHQKANVNLDVHHEGQGQTAAEQMPLKCREQQQRQPREQREDDRASSNQPQLIVRQVDPEEQPEQWSTQDRREVLRCRKHSVTGSRHEGPSSQVTSSNISLAAGSNDGNQPRRFCDRTPPILAIFEPRCRRSAGPPRGWRGRAAPPDRLCQPGLLAPAYWRPIATRIAASAETRWSELSAASAMASCTPLTRPLKPLPCEP